MHYPIWMACPSLPEPPTESLSRCLDLIGEGNGNPLQYSCLENSMDRGAWWATRVPGVPKSQTRLSRHAHIHTGQWENTESIDALNSSAVPFGELLCGKYARGRSSTMRLCLQRELNLSREFFLDFRWKRMDTFQILWPRFFFDLS